MNEFLHSTGGNLFYARLVSMVILTFAALVSDIRNFKISNRLVIIGFIVAGVMFIAEIILKGDWFIYVKGLVVTLIVMFVVYVIKAVGAGDVKLLAVLGFVIGYDAVKRIVVFTFLAAAVIGIAGVIKGNLKRKVVDIRNFRGVIEQRVINMHVIHFTCAIACGELLFIADLLIKGCVD